MGVWEAVSLGTQPQGQQMKDPGDPGMLGVWPKASRGSLSSFGGNTLPGRKGKEKVSQLLAPPSLRLLG